MSTRDSTASSEEYIYLKQRLEEIKNHFDVENLKSKLWIELNDVQMDFVRAYVILCHAEFESYFEQKSIALLDKALYAWNENSKPTITLLSLFAHFEFIEKKISTSEKINMITQRFKYSVVEQNNGIKERDIVKMFKPLGVDLDVLDAAWISTLDSYGIKRGDTVHTSAKIQQPLDIAALINDTERICRDAEDFDRLIDSLI